MGEEGYKGTLLDRECPVCEVVHGGVIARGIGLPPRVFPLLENVGDGRGLFRPVALVGKFPDQGTDFLPASFIQLKQDRAEFLSVMGSVGHAVVWVGHGRFRLIWPLDGAKDAVNPHREHRRPRSPWEARQGEEICRALPAIGIGVAGSGARFLSPLRDGDRLAVTTSIVEWNRRTSAVLHVGAVDTRTAFEVREVRCLFKARESGIVAAEISVLCEMLQMGNA